MMNLWFSTGKRTRNSRTTASNDYETLESRRVLAAIYLDASSGELFISGDSGNDVGALVASGTQVEASVTGVQSQTFNASEIATVSFIGLSGNDTFTNDTDIAAFFYGGNGNDTLTGGSNNDFINGGAGSDTIVGGGGDDRIYGSSGNDDIRGGTGNDFIVGNSGLNTIYGETGDDVLYGGVDADHIFGGDGIDQIFGLEGDDFLDSGDGGVQGTTDIALADLILGLGGNDTITGGNGLNVFWGGDGNDIITGGKSAQNRIHGQAGNDTLTGGDRFDLIRGVEGENTIFGGAGNDFIVVGENDEDFDGGTGNDTLRFNGSYSEYRINENTPNVLTVRDLRNNQPQSDNDTENIESFEFNDQSRTPAISSVQQLVVRPIVVSNSNGRNSAAFFGNAETQAEIEALIDDIYAQANVDVIWETTRTYNNTFANTGNTSGSRSTNDLETIVDGGDANGVGSSNGNVVDAYFVEKAPGFGDVGENTANGLAFVDSSGTAIHVGDNLLNFQGGLEVIAGVVAHELGHNLGLFHVEAASNLLNSGTSVASNGNYFLTTGQINTILGSSLTTSIGSNQTAAASNSRDGGTSGLSATVGEDGTITVVHYDPDNDGTMGGCDCGVCGICRGA